MLGGSTAGKSLEQLQKAVMGMDPTIQPFQALAAIQKMVKGKEMQAAMQAQQPTPQGSVAQRKMMEAAAMRNPYMAAGLGAAPVAPPVTTPMGEEAPVGMAGGGMVAFAKGGDIGSYKVDYPTQSLEDQLAAIQQYKEALGAKNDEFLDPIKQNIAKYEEDAAKKDKYAFNDALIAAGLGMMGGKSQYAMQNIGEGGLKGLAAYQDAQKLAQASREKGLAAQSEMAKSRIALEKGDETAAVQMANQARQDKQAQATLGLQAQHFYNADEAAKIAARNRGLGQDWREDVARQRLDLDRKKLMEKNMAYRLANTAYTLAKTEEERAAALSKMQAIEQREGIGTIPQAAPSNPGAGGSAPAGWGQAQLVTK